jgi:hypothetical protein
MKPSKQAAVLATIIAFGSVTQANAAVNLGSIDPSLIPLGLFFVTGLVVYLCNRPRREVVYARARRRTDAASRRIPR